MKIGLDETARSHLSERLMKILATTYAIYLKTQNYHWNVIGSEFYALHIMLEKQYEELAEAVDEIAERIRALGFFVDGSFAAFQKLALVHDEKEFPKAPEMLKRLLADHETLILYLRQQMDYVESVHDGATSDFINKRLATHEKVAWMLRSHLHHSS